MSEALNNMSPGEFDTYMNHMKNQEAEWLGKVNESRLNIGATLDGATRYIQYSEELLEILEHEVYIFKALPPGVIDDQTLAQVTNLSVMKIDAVQKQLRSLKALIGEKHGT